MTFECPWGCGNGVKHETVLECPSYWTDLRDRIGAGGVIAQEIKKVHQALYAQLRSKANSEDLLRREG